MARTPAHPEIRRVHLPESRQSIPHLHAYVRARILDGTLPPGTKLSQVQLAAQLGVSRTPVREVLRMLHEEGLVQIEPNQRTRVAGLDPRELDEAYGSRILLETLGIGLTSDRFGAAEQKSAKRQLSEMRAAARSQEIETWISVHADFHRTITSGAGELLQKQLRMQADQTIRYIRIYQMRMPRSWETAGDVEHAAILDSLIDGDQDGAASGLAHHLARTALGVLSDCAPDFVPRAVPWAVAIVDGLALTGSSQSGV